MDKFLITGTGRCGTTYCADILRVCGINCGHQSVFKHENTLNSQWDWQNYEGDSSYEAVPILDQIKEKEPSTKIILILRDKHKVAKSWINIGMFAEDMRTKFYMLSCVLDKYFPEVLQQKTPYEKAIKFSEQWIEHALYFSDYVFDIDTLDTSLLFEIIGYSHKYDFNLVNCISKKTNSSQP